MKYNDEYWQEMADEIMDCFDFEKVHSCMVALNWHWFSAGGVPEKHEIRSSARGILRECIAGRSYGTGGFYASINKEDGVLSLQFIVADWDAYKEIPNDTI